MSYKYSIIIPVCNEQETINASLEDLKKIIGVENAEIIVIDGDPSGSTINSIRSESIIRTTSVRGRAVQMNKGAEIATGDFLVFLHADTSLPINAFKQIKKTVLDSRYDTGAFSLKLDSENMFIKIISFCANLRAFITGIPFGDQAIFIKRDIFERIGGYPDIPIMEDIELMRRVKKTGGKIRIYKDEAITSARKWEKEGIFRTTFRNIILRMLYFFKIPPEQLARMYYKNYD